MQNLHTRNLTEREVGARKAALGVNPHFGCENDWIQIENLREALKREITLIYSAHPLLPIKPVANTALVRSRSTPSFVLLLAGRQSSRKLAILSNQPRVT